MKVGLLFRFGSFWVGTHWSSYNRRLCINPLPLLHSMGSTSRR